MKTFLAMAALCCLLTSLLACAGQEPQVEEEQAQVFIMGSGPAPESWTPPKTDEAPEIPPTDQAALTFLEELRTSANTLALVMPPDVMTRVLTHRVSLVMSAKPALLRLKSSTEPSMVVRGWAMEGAIAWDLAQALRDSETPDGLKPEQVAIYREAIDEKADQLETAAKVSFGECVSFANACRGSAECTLTPDAESAAAVCSDRVGKAQR